MEIRKPWFLANYLRMLEFHLNVPPWDITVLGVHLAHRGQWLSLVIDVGQYIEAALDYILEPINAGLSLLESAMVAFENLWALRTFLLDIIEENVVRLTVRIIGDIQGVYNSITGQVSSLWEGIWGGLGMAYEYAREVVAQSAWDTRLWVVGEIRDLGAGIIEPWRQVLNTISLFVEDINDLFSDPEDWLYNKIDAMLDRFW